MENKDKKWFKNGLDPMLVIAFMISIIAACISFSVISFVLGGYKIQNDALQTMTAEMPTLQIIEPTRMPTPTPWPTATQITADSFQNTSHRILGQNGFIYNPADRSCKSGPCKVYNHSRYDLMAIVYPDNSVSFGWNLDSGDEPEYIAKLLVTVTSNIWGTPISSALADCITKQGNEMAQTQTCHVNGYTVFTSITVTDGGTSLLVITVFPPRDNGS